ncbi:MAG: glycosyltransferase family 39 protein [Planctomycetes bacterium]|nr:glycosyltransferase family 39 protein [Planctomycetota bacterium]
MNDPDMLFFRRPVVFLLFAGLVVHLGVVMTAAARTGSLDGYAFRSLDCTEFYGLARNLVDQGEFTDASDTLPKPNTWRTPGYPAFLAIFIALLGESPTMLVGIQQALSIVNVLLLFLIARSHMNDRRAMVAGLFFLIEPYHLYYSLWLQSTTLFVTAILVIWIVWRRTLSTGKTRWAALLGLLTGLTILIRPAAAFIPVVLLGGLLVAKLRARKPDSSVAGTSASWLAACKTGLPCAVFVAACFAPVGGWMLRNHRVAGHFALSDQAGVVLAYFKSTEVELWRQGRVADRYIETSLNPDRYDEPHTVWDEIDRELREKFPSLTPTQRASLSWRTLAQGNRSQLDSFEVSSALSEIGLSRLAAHPLSTALCYLVRCGSMLTFPLNLAIHPPTGEERNRFVDAGMGWLYLLLCLIALARLIRERMTQASLFAGAHAYFPLAVTIALLLATTPQIDPRFRVPMIPLLIVMAMLPRPVQKPDLARGQRA